MDQMEAYVYSEHGYEAEEFEEKEKGEKDKVHFKPPPLSAWQPKSDQVTSRPKKMAKAVKVADVQQEDDDDDDVIVKSALKKPEKSKVQDMGSYLESELEGAKRKFQATVRNVALIQDMGKKKLMPKFERTKIYEMPEDEEDYLTDELLYETGKKPEVDELGEASADKVTSKYPKATFTPSTLTSPDVLAEHSRQLKGQIIVFVKKHLQAFEIDLRHIENDLVNVKKKNVHLEKLTKDLSEKLAFTEANFSQRAGDLATLKDMAESHQISIVNIMHHLDRKAEAYAVNQKVSKKELSVIEDRVLKLCVTATTDISQMENKMNDSLNKFISELDRKLYTEEFEVRLETLLHKQKMLETKLKATPVEKPAWDFEGIRPIEIKKYVVCKDGTRIKQGKKIGSWKSSYAPDDIIPILAHHSENEVSPRTALRIQKELELASNRESRRYVEGAYTKIKVGRK